MKIAHQSADTVGLSRVPTTEDVGDAMSFLSSRAVGVLKEAPAGAGSYQLTMHFGGAVERINALAQQLREDGPGEVVVHEETGLETT
ncbi:MAG: hypothetical protein JOZ41_04530 [Chloroflexi bacterium]|nr:hypothetical protein [Chloroflexota bacterium]